VNACYLIFYRKGEIKQLIKLSFSGNVTSDTGRCDL